MLPLILLGALACTSGKDDTSASSTTDEPPGVVSVSPTNIDFGQLYLEDEYSNSFSISNAGEGDLQVYDVQFADDTVRAHWTLQGGLSGVLAPGESIEIAAIAHPRTIDDISARLEVLTDDPDNGKVTVVLSAEVLGVPDVRLDPSTSLDLGTVAIGSRADGEVHIANDGTADLHIQAVRLSDGSGPFSVLVDASGATVRPQSEDGLVSVRFAPTEVGAFSDALIITSSDPVAPSVSISVTGIGSE